MMKRLGACLLALCTLTLGCGDDPTPTSPTTTTPTTTTPTTTPPANRAPVTSGSIPGQTLTVGASAMVNVAQYFSDPDGDALTYEATSSNTHVATVSVAGSTVALSAMNLGRANVRVTARDPGSMSATQSFSVTVEAPPRPMAGGACVVGLELSPGQFCTVGADRFEVQSDGSACFGFICAGTGITINNFRAARISGTDNWRIESLP